MYFSTELSICRPIRLVIVLVVFTLQYILIIIIRILWLFFLMLITLGLDSMFFMVEVMITTIMDHYREKLAGFKYLVVIITCLIGFLLGLSMCTSKGLYVFQLMDSTCATWNLIVLGLLEVILVELGNFF